MPAHTVNDIHSLLNETQVARVIQPRSLAEVQEAVRRTGDSGGALAVSGARHAMGGQQFLSGGTLLDMRSMNRILNVDQNLGIVELEAGILWSDLALGLPMAQSTHNQRWSIVQKQTGADRLTLGGALAANGHGRGLTLKPIVQDVESFVIVDAYGEAIECSRSSNPELFGLAIGGYGLFGVIASVRLKLLPSHWLERVVEVLDLKELPAAFQSRIEQGFTYGDFQYVTDEKSKDFLKKGVFSCYQPVQGPVGEPGDTRLTLSEEDWSRLILLAHVDKARAFEEYARFYVRSSGQTYHTDQFQLSNYVDGYHRAVDEATGASCPGSETITELYVPIVCLEAFMEASAEGLRAQNANVIYGTIRLIEPDDETFLNWAAKPYACIVFNLHLDHSMAGMERGEKALRMLIDVALSMGGSYFLTYNRFASDHQLKRAYPQFPKFLAHKRKFDPEGVFASDWYKHYRHVR